MSASRIWYARSGHSFVWPSVALVLALFAVVAFFRLVGARTSWTTRMRDGSRVTVRVSGGTKHVFWVRPWHALVHGIPRLPASIKSDTEPMGCDSGLPSLAIWCSFEEHIPNASPPE